MCVGPPACVQTRPLGTERALPLSRFLASGHAHCVHDCQAAKDQEHDIQSRLSGLNAVMIERSNIVGKPMAQLLLGESCTMTFAHLRTKDPADIVRRADIVVAVVRRPEIVPGDWIMPGATVIEVGINRIERDGKKKLAGDADLASCSEVAGTRIPVPGGLGPMIVACLLANTPTACYRANDLDELEGLVA